MSEELQAGLEMLQVLGGAISIGGSNTHSSMYSTYATMMNSVMVMVGDNEKVPDNCSSFKEYVDKNKED